MYGGYIKRRGWIKKYSPDKNDFICCRSPADIHKKFIFKTKKDITKFKSKYKIDLQYVKVEYKTLSNEDIYDKRVIASKKGLSYYTPELTLAKHSDNYYNAYCRYCKLLISSKEYELDSGICIHCAHELYKLLHKHYTKMPAELKESWERAKIVDEI
jgi:hypothetical protein